MKKYIYMLIAVVAPLFTACSDDDNSQSATMTISQIYLEDVNAKDEVYDRPVELGRLGQLLRIEGSGFTGLKNIYVNGYDTYFNNALMTDNNIWVTLNKETPVDKANESVRNTILLVKDNTQLSYPFTIRAAAPAITSVDNTLPMPGETVTVFGLNLQETTKVTLPGDIEVTDGIVSDEDGKWFSFTMPSGVTEAGAIVSEGANGTAITPDFFNNNKCFVINFGGTGEMGGWSATFSSDDLVDDPLNTGRGKVVQILPESLLAEGPLKAGANAKGFWTAGNDNANDDWNRMTSYIPGSTPADSVALQFDVYCPEPWDLSGQLEITIQNNLSNYGYGSACTKPSKDYINQAYAWVPWLDRETGEHKPFTTGERWQTITIPLSSFGNYTDKETAWTFQNVIDDRNAGSYRNFGILFVNPDLEFSEKIVYPATDFSQKIYFDNFRIVPITAVTVSDY